MSKGMVDHLRQLREAKMARNSERAKVEAGIRKAAAAGKELLEQVEATSKRMKAKPAKGKRKKK